MPFLSLIQAKKQYKRNTNPCRQKKVTKRRRLQVVTAATLAPDEIKTHANASIDEHDYSSYDASEIEDGCDGVHFIDDNEQYFKAD